VNKVLKQIDYKGQTTVLSAIIVLAGMMFLVPAITEKALGVIHATASGQCGPEGQTHPCKFTLVSSHLDKGIWNSLPHCGEYKYGTPCGEPTASGTLVKWSTTGSGFAGDEKGSVTYHVGEGQQKQRAVLSFENPLSGSNTCSVSGIGGSCTAGKGIFADFTYNLRGK
jgi:hypothetical protein